VVPGPTAAAGPPPGGVESAGQLALDLPHATGTSLADFLRAPCNAAALDAVLRWPDWPGPALVLSGPPGSGKTHLARIWAERAGALAVALEDARDDAGRLLRRLGGPDAPAACAIDDADRLAERDEALLFHAHNAVVGRGGSLLLTAARPPAAWPVRLPDLRSRLLAAASARIEPPDDTLLAALLVKQFADRQLRVDGDVVAFLVARIERSFAAARSVVRALDRASLRARRPVTLPLARLVLEELEQQQPDQGAR
jgi:DnaA regulatory inactivator Hda